MKNLFFSMTLCFCHLLLLGQADKADSILRLLKSDKEDTNKVTHLNNLFVQFIYSEPQKALEYAQQALKLAELLKWEQGIGNSYSSIGLYCYTQGDYSQTLDYWLKSLKIDQKLHNKSGIARSFGNIGNVYDDLGDYPKALDYYFKALKIKEELGDKDEIAITLGNMGVVYFNQGDFQKALVYHQKALKMHEELGNQKGIVRHLNNIGLVFTEQAIRNGSQIAKDSLFDKALDCYFRALKIDELLNNQWGKLKRFGNIGMVYYERESHTKALDYYFKALKLAEDLGDKRSVAIYMGNIGTLYMDTKKYTISEKYLLDALKMDSTIGYLDHERETHENLKALYEITGREKLALKHFKVAMRLKDSIFSLEKSKDITRKEMQYEFDKKQLTESIRIAEEKKVVAAQLEQEQTQRYALYGGLSLVLVFSIFIFNRYKITSKQKNIISRQKDIVEVLNKDMTDSMEYAKRIQDTVLVPEAEIKSSFSDAFILMIPKNIVSGDFYWYKETDEKRYIGVADCTAHGVPGGFMGILGFEMIQGIVLQEDAQTPADILSLLDTKLSEVLKKITGTRDGIDIALCTFDKRTKKLEYSGANRPLLQVAGNKLTHHFPSNFSIGGDYNIEKKAFTNEEIYFGAGDMFYLYSNGFIDQFGGKDGKKYKSNQFAELLVSIHSKPLAEQKQIIQEKFEWWKGNHQQVDDVLVIGIRVP